MSLHFPVRINNTTIGHFEAVRASGTDDPDSVGVYNVVIERYFSKTPPYKPTSQTHRFAIEHRYGDGAWALIHKAFTQSGFFLSEEMIEPSWWANAKNKETTP